MATFLAHIKVHEGKEKRFEIAGRDLFVATHNKEDEVGPGPAPSPCRTLSPTGTPFSITAFIDPSIFAI